MTRLAGAWRSMSAERRLAAVAAFALLVTMFFPWYQQNAVVSAPKTAPLQSRNLDAFQVFSFVEAAVLLVSVAVAYLLFARAEGREFELPGGDGTVVLAAGLWTALLLVVRLFDKPGISSHGVAGNVGVQWGIFFALLAAGLMAYAGQRMRPLARARAGRQRHSAGGDGPTISEAPERGSSREEGPAASEGAYAQAAEDAATAVATPANPSYPPAPSPATVAARGRSRASREESEEAQEQLSFEEQPPPED
jgi:hypothetical protein